MGLVSHPSTHQVLRVFNSVAMSRRLASRAIVWQAVVTLPVAVAFFVKGWFWSLAVIVGGGAISLSGAVAAWMALSGGVNPATAAFTRLLLGMLLKWLLVTILLMVALVVFRFPGLPVLAGVVAATLGMVLANSIKR